MKHVLLLVLAAVLFSCSDSTRFKQLKKDTDALFSKQDKDTAYSAVAASDSTDAKPEQPSEEHPDEAATVMASETSKRQNLVDFAKKYIGTPYKYACSDPTQGFDCSGFINFVYRHFGYEVPRSSKDFEFFAQPVTPDKAQPGDLVLFTPTEKDTIGNHIGHIGILINQNGLASDFIHASSGKANGVTVSSLSEPHYRKRFVKIISCIK